MRSCRSARGYYEYIRECIPATLGTLILAPGNESPLIHAYAGDRISGLFCPYVPRTTAFTTLERARRPCNGPGF